MNGYQRIEAAFAGRRPDRTPIMLHNFMPAAREMGVSMAEFRSDPKVIAEAFWRSVETYGFDGILVDVDTAVLAEAAGAQVAHPRDEPAVVVGPRLRTLEEIDTLEPVDVAAHRRAQISLEAVRLLVERSNGEIYIRGNCDQCPFSLAAMLRGPQEFMMELLDESQGARIERLLGYCAEVTLGFLRLMAATGCHMLSNGDSTAGPALVSPSLYRRFAVPWEKRVVAEAHRLGRPYLLHICGDTALILPDMLATGADGLEIDYKTDARLAHDRMKDRAVFVGNLDPSGVLAHGTPELVESKTTGLLELFADTPRFVLNSGCAIPADAPPANLRALIRAARGFSGAGRRGDQGPYPRERRRG